MDDERGECSSSSPAGGGGYADHMRNAMRSLAGDIAQRLQIAALTGLEADEIEHVERGTALEITEWATKSCSALMRTSARSWTT